MDRAKHEDALSSAMILYNMTAPSFTMARMRREKTNVPAGRALTDRAVLYCDADYFTKRRHASDSIAKVSVQTDGAWPKNRLYALQRQGQPPHMTRKSTLHVQISGLLDKWVTQFTNESIPLLGFPRRNRHSDQDLADVWDGKQ